MEVREKINKEIKVVKRMIGFGGMMLSSSKELFNRKESEWLWRLLQALSVNKKEKEKKKI
jgi:hypothetical protein